MRIKSSILLSSLVLALAGPVAVLAQNNAPPPQDASALQPDAAASTAPGQPQVQQPDANGVNWKGVGIGAGTVATNVLYIPAKLTYGILGGIAGGAGYVLTGGNRQVSDTIWRSSLGGDYVVTPDMMTGKEPVHFSGPTATSAPINETTADTPSAATNPAPSMTSPRPPAASSSLAPDVSGSHAIDSGAGPIKGNSSIGASALHTESYAGSSAGTAALHSDSYGASTNGSSYPSSPSSSAVGAIGASKAGVGGAPPSTTNGASDSSSSAPKYAPLPDTSIE